MMKKITLMVLIVTLACVGISMQSYAGSGDSTSEFAGVWVATVLNLDYPSKPGVTNAELRQEAIRILDQVESMGLNAVVLQVRPSADAFYKSEIFPWSKYLTGQQGIAPANAFDPLAFWIDEAHKRNIELHAWINPYRITRKTSADKAHDFASLASTHPARLNPAWVVSHTDGNLYFNPGIPEVMDLIVEGVNEIVNTYDVDGIHFDDYFYPEKNFNDASTYLQYGQDFKSIEDWRRNNVNQLIEKTYKSIKSIDPSVDFGISPFGIWKNAKTDPTGSATMGLESYESHYADSIYWIEKEIVDYIAPQIYWHIGYEIADYEILVKWWQNAVKNTSVKLIVGHAAYRAENSSSSSPWFGTKELEKQLNLNKTLPEVEGSLFFRYDFFEKNRSLRQLMRQYYGAEESDASKARLIIGRPFGDVRTTSSSYFIGGESDPDQPLFMNGQLVENRTESGYFGVFVPLDRGTNTFVFSQEEIKITQKIRRVDATPPSPMTEIKIATDSAWPFVDSGYQPGDTIRLSVKAPAGADVTVSFNGSVLEMQRSQGSYKDDMTKAEFFVDYVLPYINGTPRIENLGRPVYKLTMNGITDSLESNGTIDLYMKSAPIYGTIATDYADSYRTASSSRGADYLLIGGMTDPILSRENGYYQFSNGLWVKESAVSIDLPTYKRTYNIASVTNKVTSKYEDYIIDGKLLPVGGASFNGDQVVLTLSRTLIVSIAPYLESNLVDLIETNLKMDTVEVTFNLKESNKFGGYEVLEKEGDLVLRLYSKFQSVSTERPLDGLKVLLDPGHGGKDNGAIGLTGALASEKTVNLNLAFDIKSALESYGATVMLSREEDVYVSLQDRLIQSKSYGPDLFVSIHADSIDDSRNLNHIKGFSIFYKDPLAKPIASLLQNQITSQLDLTDRKVKTANFYVMRGTWAPSILIETGFMPNPNDYDWMMRSSDRKLFAQHLAQGIVDYFK
ncbi:N-acetylmuramoyl-L-alanine amidase [Fusibacter tunisiensis]|uniref:Uncharacterized lipoprotein YddW (UPF0748 family)/N-acetylmuramoyl-L-alanine amidase n=1 Tax=Fusibacter tunisiensis TaxID=1008308 RepID=A0ABS2MN93_9FIRM|nr:N-acetylmuramoyl-L-alanine amidase [Fusibacter tunisiensis]MBM7560792.1 uncharacterized lipoprotein YddW (UPF0748 family)/N-acetylmuramoyl-L-alanine amidase [Fusibacter tunisiensis]